MTKRELIITDLEFERIQLTYVCPVCSAECDVDPTFFEENGSPVCSDCDEYMVVIQATISLEP